MALVCQRFTPQVVMIDASGRPGSVCSNAVGHEGFSQEQDAQGLALHSLALDCSYVVLNTVTPSSESGRTYQCPQGSPHRIDYILASSAWRQRCTDCRTLLGFDNHMPVKDHFPLTALFSWTQGGLKGPKMPTCPLGPALLADASRCAVFAQRIADVQPVPWEKDINEHY
eukprot:5356149-Pyramimonas_sp.AAC.1